MFYETKNKIKVKANFWIKTIVKFFYYILLLLSNRIDSVYYVFALSFASMTRIWIEEAAAVIILWNCSFIFFFHFYFVTILFRKRLIYYLKNLPGSYKNKWRFKQMDFSFFCCFVVSFCLSLISKIIEITKWANEKLELRVWRRYSDNETIMYRQRVLLTYYTIEWWLCIKQTATTYTIQNAKILSYFSNYNWCFVSFALK